MGGGDEMGSVERNVSLSLSLTHSATVAWLNTACTAPASDDHPSAPSSACRCSSRVKGSVTWGARRAGSKVVGREGTAYLKPVCYVGGGGGGDRRLVVQFNVCLFTYQHLKHPPCSAPVSRSSDTQPEPEPEAEAGEKKRARGPCSPTRRGKGASVGWLVGRVV